jgi:heterodisulfide reductase subunit C
MPDSLIQPRQVFYCFSDCGVCVSQCPISRCDSAFSPRRIVMQSLLGATQGLLEGEEIWRCLSCGKCSYHCPAAVDFLALICELRAKALKVRAAQEQTNEEKSSREAA